MWDPDLDILVAVFLRQSREGFNGVATVARVMIQRCQLYALELVISAGAVSNVFDDDGCLAPVIEHQRKRVREYPAFERMRLAATWAEHRHVVLPRLVEQCRVKT